MLTHACPHTGPWAWPPDPVWPRSSSQCVRSADQSECVSVVFCSRSADGSSFYQLQTEWFQSRLFPIDTPLVLRLVKTHMGKCLFSPELKSYLITQWNCTTIGSCRCRKTNQWVGSGAARTYGDDTRQYSRRNGRGIWLYKRSFRHRILRFFLLQRRRLRLRWSREAYSPLTRLAVGPSDLDLLGWSAFNAPQHRSSSGPVRCRYPAIT